MSILIIGGGEVGATLADRLSSESKDVVVIEASEERVRQLRETADIHVVHGSGSNPRALAEAGLDDAEMVIAVTDSDELNLVACLAASSQSVIPTKIARVRDPDLAEAVPAMFGDHPLDLTINPEEEAANAILKTLHVPGAVGVFEFADGRVQLVAFHVDGPCDAVGVVLHDLKPKLDFDFNLVAISRDGALLIPDGRSDVRIGDRVYVAGTPEALEKFAGVLEKKQRETRHIVISGGGGISYHLARLLEAEDVAPKIIEPDTLRCKFLVERLKRTVVLQGSGTDPELLREESIDTTDAFLALTRDEEDNILSALLAKRSGASEVMALVNKPSYSSLASAIGIDAIVSPNLAAVSAILHFIRKGKVVSVTTVGEEAAEALEVVALETSELVGKPLREVDLQDAVIGAVVRGDDVIIPSGEDVIEVGDHVVIFALRSAIPRLERQMMVQLRYF
ncbi:MAG: Trk system potassium transporter TrkA [Deltaproteobacteria bacterium]|nr:Trk system potassium transporter TrkA [Deltaproteobacteria bacterium]